MIPLKQIETVIPLGTFCFTANILIRLDVRRKAYPFDFTFQKIDYLSYLLRTDFADLFDKQYLYPCIVKSACATTGHLKYGYIFRHHDLFDPIVMEKMCRRLERLRQSLGGGCVAVTTLNEAHDDYLLINQSPHIKMASLRILKLLSSLLMHNQSNCLVVIQLRHGPLPMVETIIRQPSLSVIDVVSPLGTKARNGCINVQDGSRLFCLTSQAKLEKSLLEELGLLCRPDSEPLYLNCLPDVI